MKCSVKTPTVIAATAAVVFAGAALAFDFNFTSTTDPDAPKVEPFQLPTFDGRAGTTNEYIEPLVEAPRVDADAIYAATLNCYPGASTWHIDVNLEAGYRTRGATGLDDTGIGGHYVGIVARMPLYSISELEREQSREAQRRAETAALVGQYISALNKRNTAHRELGLYSALESVKDASTAIPRPARFPRLIRALSSPITRSQVRESSAPITARSPNSQRRTSR
jgi:hypothetical protein